MTAVPAAPDPWWIAVPGMDWRRSRRWPERPAATAACAMACTARRLTASGAQDADKLRKYAPQAARLRKWLDGADSGSDAWLRRYALCLATDLAPADAEPRYLTDYAELLLYSSG